MEKGNVLVIEDRDVSRKNVCDSLRRTPFVDEVFEGKDLDSSLDAAESARQRNKRIQGNRTSSAYGLTIAFNPF